MLEIDIECNAIGTLQLGKSERFSIVEIDLKKLTDAQLLERYADGDESAFRELVGRYKNNLYAFLSYFLNRHDLVEDVFQETFLQLFSSRDSYDMSRPLSPWLFKIAANKARDAIRKLQQTREITVGTIADPEEMSFDEFFSAIAGDNLTPLVKVEKKETAALVKEVISNMQLNLREILLLAYFDGFTYKQIAEVLGIPIGTVKSRLHTAVWHFATQWKSLYGNRYIK